MSKFRPYEQDQGTLLPTYLDDLIDEHDLVRVVNRVVDQLDRDLVERPFADAAQGGAPAFSPRLMLKVLLYAYCVGLRSCRQIAKALRFHIAFMWLAGRQCPDFRTVNRFRSEYFREILPEVFAQVVLLLQREGYVTFEEVFVDGSPFEADANKHKMIWEKNRERLEAQAREKAKQTLEAIDRLEREEDETYGGRDLPERGEDRALTGESLRQTAQAIRENLREAAPTPAQQRRGESQAKTLEKTAEKLEKYQAQKDLLQGRNSCSKTDPDAGALRMKDGEIRPGYNVQVQAENGLVTNVHVSQSGSDGAAFIPLLDEAEALNLPQPERVVADAGYGHEENYAEMEERGIEGYVKFPDYHRETGASAKDAFHHSRFAYHAERDVYTCPMGQDLTFTGPSRGRTKSGYEVDWRHYQCFACAGCEKRESCTRSESGRTLQVSEKLQGYRKEARERLQSEEGKALYKQRGHGVETVFGDWKHNRKFRRFQLRSLVKVKAEAFLHAVGHNLRRLFFLEEDKRAAARA